MDLSFIVIFGTRWHFRSVPDGWTGLLECPDCEQPQYFQEKHAFKAFTLYWFPLFRTEDGGHLVECRSCQGKFDVPEEIRGGEPPEVLARAGSY